MEPERQRRDAERSEQPAPTAALALIRTGAQALCTVLGRRKAERWLREWARIAASEESIRLLFPTRPAEDREAQVVSQREAMAWLKQVLPSLFGTLPEE